MPTLNLGTVRANLEAWIAADLALASGQSFSMNGRTLTRSDAGQVKERINYWSRLEARLEQDAANPGSDQSRSGFSLAKFR